MVLKAVFQSNSEGSIVTNIYEARLFADGVIINAEAYFLHYLSIRDAVEMLTLSVAQIHIFNITRMNERTHLSVKVKAITMKIIEKLIASIPAGVDGLFLTDAVSQRYVTGFDYTDGYVLVSKNAVYLFADSRYIEAAKANRRDGVEVILLTGSAKDILVKYFENEKLCVIGYEEKYLSCHDFNALKRDFPKYEFTPISSLLETLMECKEEFEIENIISAQRIAEAALDHVLKIINRDMTEIDVALELEMYMRKNGAENVSFPTICVSGPSSSLPHGVPSNVKLRDGFLTMDFGALYKGYCSDMTRTVVIGKADNEMKHVYETVLKAQAEAEKAVKAGISSRIPDKAGRDVITEAGYGKNFGHGLGHGVGMRIHEAPRISPAAPDTMMLKSGHIITNEPGIYLEGKYGVRIEDMLLVCENGCSNLTLAPKNLIEIS